jgi:DNA repair photolyase
MPAFYSDWFYNRIDEGFLYVRNPFVKNHIRRIDLNPDTIDSIVFWTKNPTSFLSGLHKLNDYHFYFQFTVTPYDNTFEINVPPKKEVYKTFIALSERIGKEKVIWRYDPVLYSKEIDLNYHIRNFNEIAGILSSYTEKCILSFLDLYKKSTLNLRYTTAKALDNNEILELIERLKPVADSYNLNVETCAEEIDLSPYQIGHGRCIDNRLIERITGRPISAKKDKNQRKNCGCIESFDIGEYNTCMHNCLYCYANDNHQTVSDNTRQHDPFSPILIGNLRENDVIKDFHS